MKRRDGSEVREGGEEEETEVRHWRGGEGGRQRERWRSDHVIRD